MKTSNNQTGSAHVIIIIILVIAVIGLLGFVFWQNFVEKKSAPVNNATHTSAPTTQTATPNPTSSTSPTSTLTVLSLPSYGVEIPYNRTDDTYTVTAITEGSNAGSYTVLSKKIADACGDGAFGTISQTAKGQARPMAFGAVTLGEHDYSWGGYDNSSCTTNSQVDTVTAVQSAFGNAFKSIKTSN